MSKEIAARFAVDGEVISSERYGNGHINETYLVKTTSEKDYILQKINNNVFKDVPALMNNIQSVTEYLSKIDPDPRHTLHLVSVKNGGFWTQDEQGGYWRMYDFVTDSITLEKVESANTFHLSAIAFGNFQRQLADFPAQTLAETIPHFHDTPDRFRQLKEAIANDVKGRKAEVQAEIEFALAHEEEAATLMQMLANGELPLRVTHNDTKLNNIMFDATTRAPICVIDLDTVMPGLAANDFGDSIRFGASTGAEDEKDLDKIEMSLHLFSAFADGYIKGCDGALTENEIRTLPMGAKLMTLECGIRFLADYLNGDVYFRIHRPEHNLDRCRTQFKLVADMEKKWPQMQEIMEKLIR